MDRKLYQRYSGNSRKKSGRQVEISDSGRREITAGAPFTCANCGTGVAPPESGTRQRNHCPRCLHSLHVDLAVGDRRSLCRGVMEPISVWLRQDGELAILHRCTRCGVIKANRISGDDSEEALKALVGRLRTAI